MNLVKKMYHILVKRDIKTFMYTNRFAEFGKNSVLYKPLAINSHSSIFIGDNTTILNGSRMQVYNQLTGLDAKITIGNNCYICYNNSFLAGENITLEDGVLMASNILILSENHSTNPEDFRYYMDQELNCKSVIIGEGTWIGEQAIIMPGVKIGKKCVIGAGSVVLKSIPEYSMVVGTPAKVIKRYNFGLHKWEKI